MSPTRRELGCYQYDLLVNVADPREFCFVERWEQERSLDDHLATAHAMQMLADVEPLVESPPDIRRYHSA
jgi:quinol monooxygenase YgiN